MLTVKASTPDQYINQLPEDRKPAIHSLRSTLKSNIPAGFEEQMSYGMPGFVVPLSMYPSGYHCDPRQPLPFISYASQKNFIALYHMGIYAHTPLFDWFVSEYPKHVSRKLDMGKSCIRFIKPELIPYDLIGQLAAKLSAEQWISIYEQNLKR